MKRRKTDLCGAEKFFSLWKAKMPRAGVTQP